MRYLLLILFLVFGNAQDCSILITDDTELPEFNIENIVLDSSYELAINLDDIIGVGFESFENDCVPLYDIGTGEPLFTDGDVDLTDNSHSIYFYNNNY